MRRNEELNDSDPFGTDPFGTHSGQGQAEGDVLENVVNALADLFLGPQPKAGRLNGSPALVKSRRRRDGERASVAANQPLWSKTA